MNVLYWPSIINYQLLPPHSVLYWPSTQLHHLVTVGPTGSSFCYFSILEKQFFCNSFLYAVFAFVKGILLRHILWKLGIQKFCQVPWQTPSPLKVHRVYSIYLLLIFAKFQKTRDGRERFFERAGNGSKSVVRGGAGAGHILCLSADWNHSATGDETFI